MKYFPKLVGIVFLGIFSQGATAYNFLSATCGNYDFNGGNMTFNYANNLSTAEKTDISSAFSRLTAFSDSTITTNDNGDSSFARSNGQNEIYHDLTHGTAQCWVSYNTSTCNVIEADVRFGDEPWVTGDDSDHWPYLSTVSGGGRSIQGTAVHEGGHCVGMGHENTVYNMMGSDWNHVTRNGLTAYYGPGEDLSAGLINLHGERSGGSDLHRDVGVTVMRYQGVDGQYSDHMFGVLRDSSGTELTAVGSFSGQDKYSVTYGQTIQMEVTAENNGEQGTENPVVGYYLSTNSFISTTDTLVSSGSVTLGRNTPYEYIRTLTIPAGTAPGDYFLGAFIDHGDLISEKTGQNNQAYYPITVVHPPSDLTVPFAGVDDTTLHPGQAFSALAIARNDGDGPSAATTLRYYRSTNDIISTGDTQIGTDSIPVLAAGAIQAGNDPDTAPVTEGTWWIGACIDSVPGESSTANQCSTAAEITVAIQPPTATTDPVTDITAISVTARASVNPNGGATTLYFDYGTDNQYGNTVTYGIVGSGTTTYITNIPVTGLICNTTYQVRARAVNSAGTTFGTVQEFTTLICAGCF